MSLCLCWAYAHFLNELRDNKLLWQHLKSGFNVKWFKIISQIPNRYIIKLFLKFTYLNIEGVLILTIVIEIFYFCKYS